MVYTVHRKQEVDGLERKRFRAERRRCGLEYDPVQVLGNDV